MTKETEDIGLRRGIIMLNLYDQFPAPLAEAVLRRQILPLYVAERDPTRAIEIDLTYLARQGLMSIRAGSARGQTVRAFECTVLGLQLVDGFTTDPAVIFAARD